MCKFIFLVLSVVIVAGISLADYSSEKVDWCEIGEKYCESKNDHVACFDKENDENYCYDVQLLDLSKENKQEIVNRYNYNRNRVAGGEFPGIPYTAERMMRLEWDDTLEYLAKTELKRCGKNTYCRCTLDGKMSFSYVNSEKYKEHLTFTKFDKLFEGLVTLEYKWFQENVAESKLLIKLESGKVEIINANNCKNFNFYLKAFDERSYRIGCAFALTPNSKNSSVTPTNIFAKYNCYFHFTKEYSYEHFIYKYGPPCSGCRSLGMTCSTDYPNLCEILPEVPTTPTTITTTPTTIMTTPTTVSTTPTTVPYKTTTKDNNGSDFVKAQFPGNLILAICFFCTIYF